MQKHSLKFQLLSHMNWISCQDYLPKNTRFCSRPTSSKPVHYHELPLTTLMPWRSSFWSTSMKIYWQQYMIDLCGLSSLAQLDPKFLQTWNLHSKNDGLKADWYCKNSKLAVDYFLPTSNQTLELEEEDLHWSRIASCFKSVDCSCSYVYKQSHGIKQDNPS